MSGVVVFVFVFLFVCIFFFINREEDFYDISLVVGSREDVEDSLSQFVSDEVLEGG